MLKMNIGTRNVISRKSDRRITKNRSLKNYNSLKENQRNKAVGNMIALEPGESIMSNCLQKTEEYQAKDSNSRDKNLCYSSDSQNQ